MTTSFSYRRDIVQAHAIDYKAFLAHWAKNTEVSSLFLQLGVSYSD